ncbi:hypothetical protein LCGC14_0952840 [marine sediment metagenome]|uniref:ParB-like N-terminal domain-containing protein n=1 Tax=marine sediment metagenome TaxID=412755 RepID=A0A0F9RN52_9ZZZZ
MKSELKPKLTHLAITSIDMGERARKEYKRIKELALDIKEKGLIHPIAVMEVPNGAYTLLAGGRRITAHLALGRETIPCRVFPECSLLEQQLIEESENIHRDDLTYVERAEQTSRIHLLKQELDGVSTNPHDGKHTIGDTAEILGVNRETAAKDLELAGAMDIWPELRECKNRKEAMALLKRNKEKLIRAEITRRVEHQMSEEGLDAARTALINNYHVQDCFELFESLPARSVHCVEIDPPYAIDLKKNKKGDDNKTEDYNEVDKEFYVEFMERVLVEAYRVMYKDSWLILWYAIHPWHTEIVRMLGSCGFSTAIPALWIKPAGQTIQPDKSLASCYEPFFYARKGNAVIYNQGRSNTFHVSPVSPEKKIHPTERPIPLMMDVLATFCPPSGRILVPFLGSGNTILAANNLGMNAFGSDLTQSYKEAFTVRVYEGKVGEF